jgi:hypothetical protein
MLHNNQPVQVYNLLVDLSTKEGALGTQCALNLSLRLNQYMAGMWFRGLEPQVPVLVSKSNQNWSFGFFKDPELNQNWDPMILKNWNQNEIQDFRNKNWKKRTRTGG